MNEEATLLVPVDFSSFSRAAIEHACVLATARSARVQLLHALHLPAIALAYSSTGPDWTELRASEMAKLEQLRDEFVGRGPTISTLFEEGDPVEIIRAAARTPGVEMIVMGSHGYRGMDRLLLGSVAERTLHHAPVPVLIVREEESRAARPIRKILFATDFSESAHAMEALVIEWAQRLQAEVEILHVLFDTMVLFAPYAVPDTRAYDEELMIAARRRMEGVLDRFLSAGLSAKSKVVCGFASEQILERAEAIDAQWIAMGTRGHSGLRRFRLGSVAHRVLRHAPCNVLVADGDDNNGANGANGVNGADGAGTGS